MEVQISRVDDRIKYEGLRDLWHRVFGDEPAWVDLFYERFGADISFGSRSGDIEGYVICDGDEVVSALTLYKCGRMYIPADADEEGDPGSEARESGSEFCGLPVYVTYAVCTDPDHRSRGLAGQLVEFARKEVTDELGGISLVSPAEPSLEEFYRLYGYERGFFVSERKAFSDTLDFDDDMFDDDDDFDAVEPGLSIVNIGASMYNKYREAFLAGTPHVSLSDEMMEAVRDSSLDGDGLCAVNAGDAVCALAESEDGGIIVSELLINPMLADRSEEIDAEIAARLAKHFGQEGLIYRTPGTENCQCVYAADADGELSGYYGFPLE